MIFELKLLQIYGDSNFGMLRFSASGIRTQTIRIITNLNY